MQELALRIESATWDHLQPQVRGRWDAQMRVLLPAPPLFAELSAHHLTLEHFDARELAEKVSHDAVLGGRILGVANSARFGLSQPLTNIQRAMVHRGFNLVKSIISTYMIESGFARAPRLPADHAEFVRCWTSGAAVLAFRWGQQANLKDPSLASTAALLARLGTLLLAGAQPPPDEIYRHLFYETDRLTYELDAWQVVSPVPSGELARRWEVPAPLPELLGRLWIPVVRELPPDPLDPNARLLVLVAASLEIAAGTVGRSCEDIGELAGYFAANERGRLKANLEGHNLLKSGGEIWQNTRFRREYDAVIAETAISPG